MTVFRRAEKNELPKLTALWQQCFSDEPEDIRQFWAALFDHIQVFSAWEGATPLSMLCAMPLQLVDEAGEVQQASYFYAVCTHPKHRGKGLCSQLMAYAETAVKKDGFPFVCLAPAEEGLFALYEKLGYRTAFYNRKYNVPAQKGGVKITKIPAEAYQNLRQMQLYGAFADYPLTLLSWQQKISTESGAGLFRIETPEGIYCAAAEKHGDELFLKELLPDCPEVAAALGALLNCKQVFVRTEGQENPFAMAKSLCGEEFTAFSYLGLAFD